MSSIATQAQAAYRYYETDGVQSSGVHAPSKSDVQSLFASVDDAMSTLTTALISAGAVVYDTLAHLNGNLVPAANTLGFVYADGANTGLYVKVGATGVGSWSFTGFMFASPITTAKLGSDIVIVPSVSTASNCDAATTAPLSAFTYNNGTNGVGATLTANANGALAAQDGVTLTAGQKLLVKNSAAGSRKNNGCYSVTQVGDSTHPAILTRVPGADTPAGLSGVIARVNGGTQNGNDYYCPLSQGEIVIGTTSLPFLRAN